MIHLAIPQRWEVGIWDSLMEETIELKLIHGLKQLTPLLFRVDGNPEELIANLGSVFLNWWWMMALGLRFGMLSTSTPTQSQLLDLSPDLNLNCLIRLQNESMTLKGHCVVTLESISRQEKSRVSVSEFENQMANLSVHPEEMKELSTPKTNPLPWNDPMRCSL